MHLVFVILRRGLRSTSTSTTFATAASKPLHQNEAAKRLNNSTLHTGVYQRVVAVRMSPMSFLTVKSTNNIRNTNREPLVSRTAVYREVGPHCGVLYPTPPYALTVNTPLGCYLVASPTSCQSMTCLGWKAGPGQLCTLPRPIPRNEYAKGGHQKQAPDRKSPERMPAKGVPEHTPKGRLLTMMTGNTTPRKALKVLSVKDDVVDLEACRTDGKI